MGQGDQHLVAAGVAAGVVDLLTDAQHVMLGPAEDPLGGMVPVGQSTPASGLRRQGFQP